MAHFSSLLHITLIFKLKFFFLLKQQNIRPPEAPPIIIRKEPPVPETPPPLIIREQPPIPPPIPETKIITIPGKIIRPPRQIIYVVPELRSCRPRLISVERCLCMNQVRPPAQIRLNLTNPAACFNPCFNPCNPALNCPLPKRC